MPTVCSFAASVTTWTNWFRINTYKTGGIYASNYL
jgi:hypothetical protein